MKNHSNLSCGLPTGLKIILAIGLSWAASTILIAQTDIPEDGTINTFAANETCMEVKIPTETQLYDCNGTDAQQFVIGQ